MSSAVLCTLALVTPLGAMWIVWISVPDLMHTRFRHDLWELRDEIMDDLIAGKLTQSDATKRLLRSVYVSIERAPRHTLRNAVLAIALLDPDSLRPSLSDIVLGPNVPLEERERLAEHLNKFIQLSFQHIQRGTPFAWLLGGSAQLVGVASRLRSPRVENAVDRRRQRHFP